MGRRASEDIVALRYMQRGTAKRKRVQRYRRNRQRAKLQSRRWRQRNKSYLKRYRQRAQANPLRHRLVRRADDQNNLVSLDNIAFFDYLLGSPGVAYALDTDEALVLTSLGDYGIDVFIDSVVFPTEEEERSVFEVLDDLADDGTIDDIYTYEREDLSSSGLG